MRNLSFLLGIVLMGILSYSCSEDYEPAMTDSPEDATAKSRCITPEQASRNVMAFIDALEKSNSEKSRSIVKREISNVRAITVNLSSRFQNPPSGNSDTLLYIVNFADSAGFAIAGAFPNGEPIYALVDHGNYSLDMLNTESNIGFTIYLKFAMQNILNDISNGGVDTGTGGGNAGGSSGGSTNPPSSDPTLQEWEIYKVYEPKLSTKWSDGSLTRESYGKYCLNKKTGAAAVAAAQILSYFKTPSSVTWYDNTKLYYSQLNWTQIIADSKRYNGRLDVGGTPTSLDQVAHLCKYLGKEFGAKYGYEYNNYNQLVNKTTIKFDKAVEWFKTKSSLNAAVIRNYNEYDIINAVINNNLVFASGKSSASTDDDSYAWVIDGMIKAKRNGNDCNLFHCNWGMEEDRNGYYLGTPYDTNKGPEIRDDLKPLGPLKAAGAVANSTIQYSVISN